MTPVEQRVNDFEKTGKYMIKKLETTKEMIDKCDEGPSAIEHMKMTIAPDAATLISQGDSLVLETHGKLPELSKRVMTTQSTLRDKFRTVQQARVSKTHTSPASPSIFTKNHQIYPENQSLPKEKSIEKRFYEFSREQMATTAATSSATSSPSGSLGGRSSKQLMSSADIDEMAKQVTKRVNDLLVKRINEQSSEDEMTKHIIEIRVSFTKSICGILKKNF